MRNKKILFSIVLATNGNNLYYLEECLKSIRNQSYKNYEIVVVSSDFNNEIKRIFNLYKIDRIVKDRNEGLASARNQGIKNSEGSYICLTDDDCILPNNWLEKILEKFSHDENLYCLGGPDKNPLEDRENFICLGLSAFEESRRQKEAINKYAVNKIKGANVTYKKEIFEIVGYLNTKLKYGEDLDFHIRIVENGFKIKFDPDIFVWHHRRKKLVKLLIRNIKMNMDMVPLYFNKKTFSYIKYDSLITTHYLTLFLPFILIIFIFLIPNLIGLINILSFTFFITVFLYSIFTILKLNKFSIKLFFSIILLITLTTFTKCIGFYLGLIKNLINIF
jgi:GT2 family glycosyltransferase